MSVVSVATRSIASGELPANTRRHAGPGTLTPAVATEYRECHGGQCLDQWQNGRLHFCRQPPARALEPTIHWSAPRLAICALTAAPSPTSFTDALPLPATRCPSVPRAVLQQFVHSLVASSLPQYCFPISAIGSSMVLRIADPNPAAVVDVLPGESRRSTIAPVFARICGTNGAPVQVDSVPPPSQERLLGSSSVGSLGERAPECGWRRCFGGAHRAPALCAWTVNHSAIGLPPYSDNGNGRWYALRIFRASS